MPLGEREQRCLQHINENVGDNLDGKLEFWSWKSILGIRDVDVYHRIAQAFEVQDLSLGKGLFFNMRVPIEAGDRFGDQWSVSLLGDENKTKEFVQKYGQHYKVGNIWSESK